MLPFELTKDTPYLALSGELWSVFYEYFNRNWSCYKGFPLYILTPRHPYVVLSCILMKLHCNFKTQYQFHNFIFDWNHREWQATHISRHKSWIYNNIVKYMYTRTRQSIKSILSSYKHVNRLFDNQFIHILIRLFFLFTTVIFLLTLLVLQPEHQDNWVNTMFDAALATQRKGPVYVGVDDLAPCVARSSTPT